MLGPTAYLKDRPIFPVSSYSCLSAFFSQELYNKKEWSSLDWPEASLRVNHLNAWKKTDAYVLWIGKSTVSKLLVEQNIPIIDADKIAREIVEPGRKANQLIRQHFGDEVFLPDGHIDRPKLGQIIFQDPEKRKILNHCTHPYVRLEMAKQAFYYWIKGADIVIFDVPLLIESKLDRFMSTTVVVFWWEKLNHAKRNKLTQLISLAQTYFSSKDWKREMVWVKKKRYKE